MPTHPFTWALALLALSLGSAHADEAALKAAVEARDHAGLAQRLQAGERPEPLPAQAGLMRLAAHPLALAVGNRDLKSAELLLRSGLPADDLRQIVGLVDRQPALLALFLEHGLDPNAKVLGGMSLAASATLDGDTQTLALLAQKGAQLDVRDAEGNTLLHLAQRSERRKRPALVAALLARGLPVQASNQAGNSVLHLAFEDADADTIEHLLAAGASLEARNQLGLSPLASLWSSSRNQSLQARHPASSLSTAERDFAVQRQIESGDSCRALAPLVAAAGGSVPEAWTTQAVQRSNPACLQRLLALGASPQLMKAGLPLWLHELQAPDETPKLVVRQLIAAGAKLPPGPLPGMGPLAHYLAEPAQRDWWRLAGFTLKTPLLLRPDSPPVTVAAWLQRTAPKTLAAWKQPNPLKPRALHGPGWATAQPELTGRWRQQAEGRNSPDPDEANEWQFAADGRFAGKLNALFLKLEPQGRWQALPEGLQLQGETDPAFRRLLTPLLWVGDEIWFDDPLGVQRYKRVARQVDIPAAPLRDAAHQCAAAAKSLHSTAPQFKALLEQPAGSSERQAQLRGLAARLSDTDGFQDACLKSYDHDPRMKRLTDCLGTVQGLMGTLVCAGMAAEAAPQP